MVNGVAGFIGSNLVKRNFKDFENVRVVSMNAIPYYYDITIKHLKLSEYNLMLTKTITILNAL